MSSHQKLSLSATIRNNVEFSEALAKLMIMDTGKKNEIPPVPVKPKNRNRGNNDGNSSHLQDQFLIKDNGRKNKGPPVPAKPKKPNQEKNDENSSHPDDQFLRKDNRQKKEGPPVPAKLEKPTQEENYENSSHLESNDEEIPVNRQSCRSNKQEIPERDLSPPKWEASRREPSTSSSDSIISSASSDQSNIMNILYNDFKITDTYKSRTLNYKATVTCCQSKIRILNTSSNKEEVFCLSDIQINAMESFNDRFEITQYSTKRTFVFKTHKEDIKTEWTNHISEILLRQLDIKQRQKQSQMA